MNARQLTARLKGKWHDGKAFGLAACPAHDDASPSLSIGTGDDGRTLVHCLAGCSQERVIAALRGRGGVERAKPCTGSGDDSRPAGRRSKRWRWT